MPEDPGDIFVTAEKFRRDLLAMERAASVELVKYYGGVWREINRRIIDLVGAHEPSGQGSNWLYQYDRLTTLQHQVEVEMARFAAVAVDRITENQRVVTELAGQHAEVLVRAESATEITWNRLPDSALKNLIGFTQNGSPLKTLFDNFGFQAGEDVKNGLIQGLALGQNPRATAGKIREAMGLNLTRALVIARTETLRSYREATHQSYQANSDVVSGWIWLSAHQDRTCAVCWALDGTRHTSDERQVDHPNGRCGSIPIVPGLELEVEKGVDVFEKLGDDRKLAILGPAKYLAYKEKVTTLQGKPFSLGDLVGVKPSKAWGPTIYEKSLAGVVGPKKAAEILQSKEYKELLKKMALDRRPIDKQLTEIMAGKSAVTNDIVKKVITHISKAEFYSGVVPVKKEFVGQTYLDRVVRSRDNSLFAHLVKRVLGEKQWASGTDEVTFLKDLHGVAKQAGYGVAVYNRKGGNLVAIIGKNNIPAKHKGENPESLLAVIYSIDRGKIISGYQVSALDKIDLPEDMLWLKKLE